MQALDALPHGLFGSLDGKAHHRAALVDHEYQFLGDDLLRAHPLRRLEDQREEIPPLVGVRQERVLDPVAGRLVIDHEVLVGDRVALFQPHHGRSLLGVLVRDLYLVLARLDEPQRQARVDRQRDRDVVARPGAFCRHLRRDPVGIGHLVGGRGEPKTRRTSRGPRHVTRSDDGGEHELKQALFPLHGLAIRDRDLHLRPRHDVGHRLRENVRPLLVQQASHLAGRLGLLVHLPGFISLLDLPFDRPAADLHRHPVHGRIVGERKHVDRLDRTGVGVVKLLADRDPSEKARNLGLHVGVFQRAVAQRLAGLVEGLQAAAPLQARGFGRCAPR